MRHTKLFSTLFSEFAPPWVLLLFVFNVIEALVLAVYFQAHVPDAEMASMSPPAIEFVQEPEVTMHAKSACDSSAHGLHGDACRHYH